jgi:hypothetical protein
MGLSIAIGGGVTMMALLFIFGILSIMIFQLQVENIASSQAFDNNDEISKTSISISGINSTVGANLVNFTLTNEGSEKLWNYDEFDVIIRYDADISGTKTRVTEQFRYNATAFDLSASLESLSPDFNVQHGCSIIAPGNFNVTLTPGIDYTVPTGEAFVRIVNTRLTGNGPTTGNFVNQDVEDFTAFVGYASDFTNEINFTRPNNPGGALDTRVCWELIDYRGLPDGPNAIRVLDRNFITYASSFLTATGSSTSISPMDDNDVVVFITGQSGDDPSQFDWNNAMSTSEWLAGTDQPQFTRGQADGSQDANDISYAVVEFSGSNWKVQRVEHNYSGVGPPPETEPITAVNSLGKAFLHTQHRTGNGLDDLHEMGEEAWLSDVDEISFDLEDTADAPYTDYYTVAWVIENTQNLGGPMSVQHISGSRAAGGGAEDIFIETVPSPVGLIASTSIIGENGISAGAGNSYPRGALALELTDIDEVTIYRADTGQPQDYRFSVVEWPQSTACSGGTSNIIETNEWTINCIKFDYFEPGIINSNESPEILTKLQYPIFVNGLLEISVSTNHGNTATQTTTVN